MGVEQAVDGGRAQTHKELLCLRSNCKFPFPLEHGHDLGEERGQPLGTDAATGLPDLKEGCFHVGGVQAGPSPPIEVLWAVAMAKEPERRLTVVAGEGHELIEDSAFLLAACPKVPGSPALHQFPYTHPGHRFLL